jgi:hypothetical protein
MQGHNRPTGLLSSYSNTARLSCCTEANAGVFADCTLFRCHVHAGCASQRTRAAWTAGFRSSSRRRPHDTQPEPSVVSTTGLTEQPPRHHPMVTTHLRRTKSTSIPREISSRSLGQPRTRRATIPGEFDTLACRQHRRTICALEARQHS